MYYVVGNILCTELKISVSLALSMGMCLKQKMKYSIMQFSAGQEFSLGEYTLHISLVSS